MKKNAKKYKNEKHEEGEAVKRMVKISTAFFRTFNGKWYHAAGDFTNKRDAEKREREQKSFGYNTKLVKIEDGWWMLYIRKEEKKKKKGIKRERR